MRTLISLEGLSHEDWLVHRKRGIGSSTAPAAIGVSPWVSPLECWTDLVGLNDRKIESEAMEWGTTLEPVIADKYQAVTGRNIVRPTAIYQHDEHDFMIGNPDRFIEGDERGLGVLEIKTTGAFHASDWESEPPLHYQVQLQHLLAVTGATWGSFAVLIGGQKFRWQDQVRNEQFIQWLIKKETDFWQKVVSGEPPRPDDSESSRRALELLYPVAQPDKTVALPADADAWAAQLAEAKAAIKKAEELKRQAENNIKAAIGDAEMGVFPDGSGYKWANVHKDSYVVKASDIRVLREFKVRKAAK